jgi:hypothetical protein
LAWCHVIMAGRDGSLDRGILPPRGKVIPRGTNKTTERFIKFPLRGQSHPPPNPVHYPSQGHDGPLTQMGAIFVLLCLSSSLCSIVTGRRWNASQPPEERRAVWLVFLEALNVAWNSPMKSRNVSTVMDIVYPPFVSGAVLVTRSIWS